MAKRISQSQIAKELGVSQSLVSLVLNGRRDGISDESYNKIWRVAVANGYVPRGMQPVHAPEARRNYVGIVQRSGLKLDRPSNTFSHVQQGLFKVLQQARISTTFLGGERDLDEKKLFELLGQRDPLQGIVLFGEVSEPFLRALGALRVVLLSVYASAPGLCHSVVPNEKQSLEQLVAHLVKLGHTRFAWLGGNCRLGRHRARLGALRECLASRQIELDERHIVSVENGDRQEGFDCAEELMNRLGDDPSEAPTAWVCHNGLMARGAHQFALLRGIRVPEEVSIAAVDRTRICTEIHPYLTSAGSNPEVIGEEAAKLLCKTEEPGENRIFVDLVVPSEFVEGETSGPAPNHA
ncbi:LacI family DNA-binding transcriptional regulator [Aporhodopirellula aestuarii]|uniref:LacI family transcriptional regulator n=1 Tax=Aporhodopirellula aestuarii TaxID=2950107 RepID=A0ABT0TYC1_9BACT|nr:LacI family DNA-binding transcriptional regulator [Aporhodopirellula aestuarii]MCM2369602.1 LacI family transcriptional regulator [Aporhodopirellula aestuarii]